MSASWLLAAAAVAGAPPGLDLEATDAWQAAADGLLDGPPGCWEAVGRATWDHDFGRWGGTRGDAAFAGRLIDGVWGELRVVPLGEIVTRRGEDAPPSYTTAARFVPMFGRVRGLRIGLDGDRQLFVERSRDARVDPVNTARDVLDRLTASVEVGWAEWSDERGGVELVTRTTAGRRDATVRTRTFFPDGAAAPAAWTLDVEGTYVHDGLVPARVDGLFVDVRVAASDGVVLPTAEAARFELRLASVTLRAAQTLRYERVAPCPTETP